MLFDLTEDEVYWISVAVENGLASAVRTSASDDEDPEDVQDAVVLMTKYVDLQQKFPPSGLIGLADGAGISNDP